MKLEHRPRLQYTMSAEENNGSNRSYFSDQSYAPDYNKNENMLERELIKGTPFWIIGNSIDGYFLAFGKYRLGDVKNTKEEILEYLNQEMWTIIGFYTGILVDLMIEEKIKNGELVADTESVN